MRNKAQILDDGLRATKEPVAEARSAHQINLLTLEVLVDIRDEISNNTRLLAILERKTYGTD